MKLEEDAILMKILFVDDMLWGHHVPYLKALAENNSYESVVLIPEKIQGSTIHFIFTS